LIQAANLNSKKWAGYTWASGGVLNAAKCHWYFLRLFLMTPQRTNLAVEICTRLLYANFCTRPLCVRSLCGTPQTTYKTHHIRPKIPRNSRGQQTVHSNDMSTTSDDLPWKH